MLVFGTQMHLVTFVFLLLEVLLFFYQYIYYLQRPGDKGRMWYLILLFLLIVYNITGGLFPDPNINIPIVIQNMIAYGSGFLIASYFPFYFYKGFELKRLRFHAIYGVFIFLLVPYLVFFVIDYSIHKNLTYAIHYGIIIPGFYSLVLLWAILRSIRFKYKENKNDGTFWEVIAVYCAVIPWVSMTVITYFHGGQLIEVIFTNGGFIVITIIFISSSIKRAKLEFHELQELKMIGKNNSPYFEPNCIMFGLTQREIEAVQLIRQGMRNGPIADALNISESTVKKHIENMFHKTGAGSRMELIHKLVFTPNS